MTDQPNSPAIYGAKPSKERDTGQAMWRGIKKKCPACGEGPLFNGYIKVHESCSSCGLDFTHQRADDGPPYFTMMIVGHTVIPLALEVKRHFHPPLGLQFLIWGTVMALMTWQVLPMTKGALIGLQWAKKMHGFSDGGTDETGLDRSTA